MMNVESIKKQAEDLYYDGDIDGDTYDAIWGACQYGIGNTSDEWYLFDGHELIYIFIRMDGRLGYAYPVIFYDGLYNKYSEGNTLDGFGSIFEIIEAVKAERNNIIWK